MSDPLSSTTEPPPAVEDAELIRGLHGGDRAAWTALYDQYSSRVWRYTARMIGGNTAVIADVVQETFLAAARGARQFDPARGTLWAWLAGITHNFVATHWRQEARQSRLALAAQRGGLASPRDAVSASSPPQLIELSEQAELVRRVLAQLPVDYALVLVAKYVDGVSPGDLPNVCGGTTEAVRSRLARARKEFRDTYERLSAARD